MPAKSDYRTYDLTSPLAQRSIRFLEDLLMEHPEGLPAKDVLYLADNAGISERRARIAKAVLNVTSHKEPDCWVWFLSPGHIRVSLPEPDPFSYTPRGSRPTMHPPAVPNRSPNPPNYPHPMEQHPLDDAVREWARKRGHPIPNNGPIPRWAVEGYERDAAKPIKRITEVSYQSYCPRCGKPSAMLTRSVEVRETEDGVSYGIPDHGSEVRSVLCEGCKVAKVQDKRQRVEMQIETLEYYKRQMAAGDPNTHEICSADLRIQELRRELERFEELIAHA
ncbi:hypothetical protein [Pseudonocardia kunmingensis]|uniref:Uncharacterized protein n=1 Tax=Pseudonocardia kunmingensis TaxID=630975 RepID=A0A543DAT2_9PSEU|nr:hypothetical protein [Pseudonocardia kunmingensis]TQM06444.1 hypothetical protein FB558_6700 [Pseudonocardia kunmingensis]